VKQLDLSATTIIDSAGWTADEGAYLRSILRYLRINHPRISAALAGGAPIGR